MHVYECIMERKASFGGGRGRKIVGPVLPVQF